MPDNIPVLDDDRWAWSWSGNEPRRVLTDGVSDILAGNRSSRRNDYGAVHESTLPFLAYELSAIAYDTGGTEYARREALRQSARLNREIGTEAAFYTLLGIVRSAGYHTYASGGTPTRVQSVECFLTPPVDRDGDAEFIALITDRARRIWPYTLDVTAIHILRVISGSLFVSAVISGADFGGF